MVADSYMREQSRMYSLRKSEHFESLFCLSGALRFYGDTVQSKVGMVLMLRSCIKFGFSRQHVKVEPFECI